MNNKNQVPSILSPQWDIIGSLQIIIADLTYYHRRQADFWEWLENEKGLNNEELYFEFEKWEETNY